MIQFGPYYIRTESETAHGDFEIAMQPTGPTILTLSTYSMVEIWLQQRIQLRRVAKGGAVLRVTEVNPQLLCCPFCLKRLVKYWLGEDGALWCERCRNTAYDAGGAFAALLDEEAGA